MFVSCAKFTLSPFIPVITKWCINLVNIYFSQNHQSSSRCSAVDFEWNLASLNCWRKQWLLKMILSSKLIKQAKGATVIYLIYVVVFFFTSTNRASRVCLCVLCQRLAQFIYINLAQVEFVVLVLVLVYILMSDCTAMNKTRTLRIYMPVIYNLLCCQNIESANFQLYAWPAQFFSLSLSCLFVSWFITVTLNVFVLCQRLPPWLVLGRLHFHILLLHLLLRLYALLSTYTQPRPAANNDKKIGSSASKLNNTVHSEICLVCVFVPGFSERNSTRCYVNCLLLTTYHHMTSI